MTSFADTIFALASGSGTSGVAVIRLSGTKANFALETLTNKPLPTPRLATLALLVDRDGVALDKALILRFEGPASFTGEDVVELHLHGGRAVIDGVISALGQIEGLRPAEPGEFTRRAFENGKMDLTEAEALADLIHAETEAQRKQALRQMDGALSALYEDWRHRLVGALAYAEAGIDFSDEELPEGIEEEAKDKVRILDREIAAHLADGHRGEMLRDGVHIAILGPPNAGKSSLLNLLAKREAAIVSDQAGTTRDIIEVHLNLGGYPAILADTAGLRESGEAIEAEGIRRALARAEQADFKIVVLDGKDWPAVDDVSRGQIDQNCFLLLNKAECLSRITDNLSINGVDALPVSVKENTGINQLLARLEQEIEKRCGADTAPALTRERHRQQLEITRNHIADYLQNPDTVLGAEDLRLATRALGRITGRVDVEDLLDVIFSDFCIGK